MTAGIAAIHVRKHQGKLKVQGYGRTGRGVKFLKKQVPLKAKSTTDPNFKNELKAAVDELLAESPPTP